MSTRVNTCQHRFCEKFNTAHTKICVELSHTLTLSYQLFKIFSRILVHSSALWYQGPEKSLARPTSQCILFDGENISFDASLVLYINSTNIPPIMIINRIYQNQNLLSL